MDNIITRGANLVKKPLNLLLITYRSSQSCEQHGESEDGMYVLYIHV